MSQGYKNRITFGDFRNYMVEDVPTWYLKILATNPWVRLHENDIYKEARALAEARNIPLVEKKYAADDADELREGVQLVLATAFRSMAAKYHPDQNKDQDATAKMAAINEYNAAMKAAVQEYFENLN